MIKSTEKFDVVCLGACCIDIIGIPNEELIVHDSNFGKIRISSGGVCRNVAENLSRLGLNTKLISCVGDDLYGQFILHHTKNAGVNIDDVIQTSQHKTPTHLAILEQSRDMYVAVSNVDAINVIDINLIQKCAHHIENASIVFLDSNLNETVIDFVFENFLHKKIVVDPVCLSKSTKVVKHLKNIYVIKPNQYEASHMSGIDYKDPDFNKKIVDWFLAQGVQKVFISLAENGVLYGDKSTYGIIQPIHNGIVNCNGAGDAFCGGLIYSILMNFDIKYTTIFSSATSGIAIGSDETVSQNMSVKNVSKMLEINNYDQNVQYA